MCEISVTRTAIMKELNCYRFRFSRAFSISVEGGREGGGVRLPHAPTIYSSVIRECVTPSGHTKREMGDVLEESRGRQACFNKPC